jgi:putative protein-disulfide isomerase
MSHAPATVVYGNDPLCGWCFAIGPALEAARRELAEEVAWRIECGGLVVGARVRAISYEREYLRNGFDAVRRASGRAPGQAYWSKVVDPGTWVSDSEPACRAVLLARQVSSERAVAFAHGLTDALYLDGDLPDDPQTIRRVAETVGLDAQALLERWGSDDAKRMTEESFRYARGLGISTYPSLLLEAGEHRRTLLTGFATTEAIVQTIRVALSALSR